MIVEAYRHLIETVKGMQPHMVGPRRLVTCEIAIAIAGVLDLREGASRDAVGLTVPELSSEVGDYGACHRVGQAAHELGLHGVIAPAAGGLGETLAVFEDRLSVDEQPTLIDEQAWESPPADPRTEST